MSEKLRRQISTLLTIMVFWMLFGLVISIYDHFTLASDFSLGPSADYSFMNGLILNVSAAFMGSLMGGIFLVFYLNERFRDKPYGYGILAVCISYIVIVTLITLILGVYVAKEKTGGSIFEPEAQQAYIDFLKNPLHVKNILIWSIVVGLTQLILQMNYKFGHGILWDFILGRYHSPRQEDRIFMFLDLKSSTTIAEKLGNEKYYSLLRDFYADITDAIVYNKGNIYQYVGDEVIVSWTLENGLNDNRCLKCYFDIRETINGLSDKYLQKYGLVPDFKAGLHYGRVTAGEIGIIKRDITYSGDVLNTSSRIQDLCNEHKVNILVSDDLLDLLPKENAYSLKSIGAIQLRGKLKEVGLSTVELSR
ncbi:adenylate/guanylate cyclase domain-containing protein [Fulvivirgaceae bacterium BMA10]|uniref:Adenylate/guanylate cyclase domain-containing protein n=1 Tax=Splendidivirga corallicola TaxID=3051826 RepID=A0ABT8KUL8_9BACT|nr:adenylate/guanylate cyclase domain-containing protein [Fulvivirgaceae bacterium BMA10]